MLDTLRYLICWMPIILTIMHFTFKAMGLEESKMPIDEAFDEAGSNETDLLTLTLQNSTVSIENAFNRTNLT